MRRTARDITKDRADKLLKRIRKVMVRDELFDIDKKLGATQSLEEFADTAKRLRDAGYKELARVYRALERRFKRLGKMLPPGSEKSGSVTESVMNKQRVARELVSLAKELAAPSRRRRAQHLENVKKLAPMLDDRELTRAIRDAIIAEEGAINQYETIVDSTDNELAKEVLQDIANEEKVHVGELQRVLAELLDDEQDFLDEGAGEVEEEME